MRHYELTEAADADIAGIARYTIATWGMARHEARTRIVFKHRPELLVSRVEHHYVFHQVRKNQCPLILAVLHESMDLINRLRGRLEV